MAGISPEILSGAMNPAAAMSIIPVRSAIQRFIRDHLVWFYLREPDARIPRYMLKPG
jgi:hypothetical protein